LGFKKLTQTDPQSRPENPKNSGPEPLCHSSDDEAAKKAFKKELKHFWDQYIQASADYRGGMKNREFPDVSFKPQTSAVRCVQGRRSVAVSFHPSLSPCHRAHHSSEHWIGARRFLKNTASFQTIQHWQLITRQFMHVFARIDSRSGLGLALILNF
jgi:hypothetical protein